MAEGLYQNLDIVVSISADTGIVTNIDMSLDSSVTLSDTFYSGFGLGSDLNSTLVLDGSVIANLTSSLSEDVATILTSSGVTGALGSLVVSQDTSISLSHFNIDGSLASSSDISLLLEGGINATGTLTEVLNTLLTSAGIVSTSFGDLDTAITTLSMNTRTYGVSEYSNFNFNSFFNIGAKYYGCCSDGIFELTGDLDGTSQVAQSIIKTGVSDFGSQQLKATKDCYVYIRSSGDNTIRLIINEQTDRAGYPINYDNIDGIHRRRIKVAQGLRGTSWQTEFRNDSGADFTLKQIDLIPKELARSI